MVSRRPKGVRLSDLRDRHDEMRALHAYKIYRPDVYGGIPNVIATLGGIEGVKRLVLVARGLGLRRQFRDGADDITAVTSFGTLLSTPMAPSYPFVFARRARAADLIVHHVPFPLVDIGLLLGLPSSAALVVHWHAEMIGRPFLARLIGPIIRHTLERADRIVVSDPIMIERSRLLARFAGKCVTVPYGCDVDYWHALDDSDREAVERIKASHPKLVVAVGRLVSYKGFEVLVRAMQSVDAQAVIIGEGALRSELEALAVQLGVAGKVTFAGGWPRDQVRQYFHAADVFAFPSVTGAEAFGIAQIEAMAAGLPVVNTSVGTAVPRIARDGLEALTVQPGDPAAMALAIRRLIADNQLARRLGSAGYQRARAEFGESRFRARMAEVYREAVEGRQMKE